MIFFGKNKRMKAQRLKIGITFVVIDNPAIVNNIGIPKKRIPHYYLTMYYGRGCCWVGYNRFKRIIRDEIYELDGVKHKIYKNNKGDK